MKRLTIALDPDTHARLKTMAALQRTTIRALILSALATLESK